MRLCHVDHTREPEIYLQRRSRLCRGGSPGCRVATRRDSCGKIRPRSEYCTQVGGHTSPNRISVLRVSLHTGDSKKTVRHVCLARLVGNARTWALMRDGMSRSLFSIFARTLDKFILSLARSEDMTSTKVVGGAEKEMRWWSKVYWLISSAELALASLSSSLSLSLVLAPTLSEFLRVAYIFVCSVGVTTCSLPVTPLAPVVSQNVFANQHCPS